MLSLALILSPAKYSSFLPVLVTLLLEKELAKSAALTEPPSLKPGRLPVLFICSNTLGPIACTEGCLTTNSPSVNLVCILSTPF